MEARPRYSNKILYSVSFKNSAYSGRRQSLLVFDLRTRRAVAKEDLDAAVGCGHVVVPEAVEDLHDDLAGRQVRVGDRGWGFVGFFGFLVAIVLVVVVIVVPGACDKIHKAPGGVEHAFLDLRVQLIVRQGNVAGQLFAHVARVVTQKGVDGPLGNVGFLFVVFVFFVVVLFVLVVLASKSSSSRRMPFCWAILKSSEASCAPSSSAFGLPSASSPASPVVMNRHVLVQLALEKEDKEAGLFLVVRRGKKAETRGRSEAAAPPRAGGAGGWRPSALLLFKNNIDEKGGVLSIVGELGRCRNGRPPCS